MRVINASTVNPPSPYAAHAAAGHVFITSQNVKQNVTDLLGRKAAAKLFDEQVGLRARARARGKRFHARNKMSSVHEKRD